MEPNQSGGAAAAVLSKWPHLLRTPPAPLVLTLSFSLSLSLVFTSVDHPSLEAWLETTSQLIAALRASHRKQSDGQSASHSVVNVSMSHVTSSLQLRAASNERSSSSVV